MTNKRSEMSKKETISDVGVDILRVRNLDRVKPQFDEMKETYIKQIKNNEMFLHELEYLAENLVGLCNHFKKQVFKKGDRVLVDMRNENLAKDFYWGTIEKFGSKRVSIELETDVEIHKDWIIPIKNLYNPKWGER